MPIVSIDSSAIDGAKEDSCILRIYLDIEASWIELCYIPRLKRVPSIPCSRA